MCAKRRKRNDIYELIAYNIKKQRKLAGITQAQLADRTGYSHEYIRRIEAPSSVKHFSIDTISIIADALDIDIRNLFDKLEDE